MAYHEMRDHRQAPVWPRRPAPSEEAEARRRREAIFLTGVRALQEEALRAAEEVEVNLRDLTDEELDAINATDPLIYRRIESIELFWVSDVGGECGIDVERCRRAAITGHQRIAENARRRELRGDLA